MSEFTEAQFVVAAALADIPTDEALAVEIDGLEIALVRDGDTVYAIKDECSHSAVPLSEGEVEGSEIECWLHGSRFDLTTGKPLNLPAVEPVPIYPTRIEGDTVLVSLEPITGVN
ncbi:non-heme iron oxygenase ferredoxin subunit [soil metagenome]